MKGVSEQEARTFSVRRRDKSRKSREDAGVMTHESIQLGRERERSVKGKERISVFPCRQLESRGRHVLASSRVTGFRVLSTRNSEKNSCKTFLPLFPLPPCSLLPSRRSAIPTSRPVAPGLSRVTRTDSEMTDSLCPQEELRQLLPRHRRSADVPQSTLQRASRGANRRATDECRGHRERDSRSPTRWTGGKV